MTRINLIDPSLLCDKHLMAEYRELIRIPNAVFGRKMEPKPITDDYVLGEGHVKFFSNKLTFLLKRHWDLYNELAYRGFKVNRMDWDITERVVNGIYVSNDYEPTDNAVDLNLNRIIERLPKNPKWTNRSEPDYYIRAISLGIVDLQNS